METEVMREELKNSLGKILKFAGCDEKLEENFRLTVAAYRKLSDKTSREDQAVLLRRRLSELFYKVYKAAFRAVIKEGNVPTVVSMFLNFGYVDEELAGMENAMYLYLLCRNLPTDPSRGVYSFFQCLSPMPRRMGRSIVTMFCIKRLRTGRWIPAAAPVCAVTACITGGIVNSVTMLLTAVRETESATSPFASLEKTLLELPPGQQAMSTSPILIIGLRLSNDAMPQAMSGNIIICPARPAVKALNLFSTRRKSLPSSVSPRSNISNVRMGSTIRILFMSTYTLNTTSLPKGIRARPAILKWRVPNGMPMMVMQRRTPKKMCIRQAQSPPKISQRMFSGMLMQPMELSDFLMVEPKGQRQYSPSLKVCNATGIPIMVMAIARLPVK